MSIFLGPRSLVEAYIGNAPVNAIYQGATLIWERVRELVMVFVPETTGHGRTDHGEHVTFTVDVPEWATAVEAVLIGAGAHGVNGVKAVSSGNRQGGAAGAWSIGTLPVTGGSAATITVARGTSTSPPATTLVVDGNALSTGTEGGPRPTGGPGGTPDPVSQLAFGVTHTAGAGGAHLAPGTSPGGGGGGGWSSNMFGTPKPGAPGGNGRVWLRFTRASEAPTIPPFVVGIGTGTYSARDALRTWAEDRGLAYGTATAGPAELDIREPGNMRHAFNGWSALTHIPEGNWVDANQMDSAFNGCASLSSAELTFAADDASNLFTGCGSLQTATITAPNLGTARSLFSGCTSLATVSLNTPALKNASNAFRDCKSLTSVDFHLPALETMSNSFYGSDKLQSVTITGAANMSSVSSAFNGCTSLSSLILDGCGPNMANAGAMAGRLDLSDTKLTASAANALMRALGNTPADKTPRLTLPSTAAGANTALAANKGWEVVMA